MFLGRLPEAVYDFIKYLGDRNGVPASLGGNLYLSCHGAVFKNQAQEIPWAKRKDICAGNHADDVRSIQEIIDLSYDIK